MELATFASAQMAMELHAFRCSLLQAALFDVVKRAFDESGMKEKREASELI
jgi:hypothetical protein